MHRISPLLSAAFLFAVIGCSSDKDESETADPATNDSESDAEWSELDETDADDTDDKEDDDDKEEDDTGKDEYNVCGDEVVAGASCDGGWEDSLCVDDDGVFWWCESGEWTSDKDR